MKPMKNKLAKTFAAVALAVTAGVGLSACAPPADVVSQNLSNDADNFKVDRRIVFYNGITGEYMMTLEGKCSLGNDDKAGELSVTCKVGEDKYIKDFLGLSDNVTYFVEQTTASNADPYHYKVTFNPGTLIPDINMASSGGDGSGFKSTTPTQTQTPAPTPGK